MNTKKLVSVSENDVSDAYTHFRAVFYPDKAGMGSYFWAFLGLKTLPIFKPAHAWVLPEKAAHYVNLLKGPHYKAIAKAMVINGHQYKEPLK